VTINKVLEATYKKYYTEYKSTDVRHIWLESESIRQLGHSLGISDLPKPQIDNADTDPALICSGIDEVVEPVKHARSCRGDVRIGK
jgi:hypothetical protein